MSAIKKFRIVIEQVKRDYHEMILEGESIMIALDQAREMAAKRNEQTKATGNVYSVLEIEEFKNE